jgi:hypothetical protein
MDSMNRSLGVVAWTAATLFSVLVSTAAVEAVRDQVTERPQVVSLASLRRATSTTMSLAASTSAPPSTISTTVPATPATSAAPSSTFPATVASVAPTSTTHDVDARRARLIGGTVDYSFDGASISLVAAEAAAGYDTQVDDRDPTRLIVRFDGKVHYSVLVVEIRRNGKLDVQEIERDRDVGGGGGGSDTTRAG